MDKLNTLENKIKELEARIKILENQVSFYSDSEDKQLMDALYNKAKELVIKHHKSSPMFLQKKLLIDLLRAKKIHERLYTEGLIER